MCYLRLEAEPSVVGGQRLIVRNKMIRSEFASNLKQIDPQTSNGQRSCLHL